MRRQERCRWRLTAHPGSQARPRRPAWQQAADKLRAAIRSAELAPGDALPSVPELHQLQGIKPGTVRHAFLALAEEGLVHIRHGRTTTITGEPV
jgi:DNA-binding GntR family transcriptional regulator